MSDNATEALRKYYLDNTGKNLSDNRMIIQVLHEKLYELFEKGYLEENDKVEISIGKEREIF